jgi:acetoacetyl-CoA synthetase
MKVEIFDDDGRSLPPGEKGELVCTAPFPTMPLGFWNDPDGSPIPRRLLRSVSGRVAARRLVRDHEPRRLVIYGRSDAVLNPGGVRIGTAEIYRQVEKLDEVVESIVIGQDWQKDVAGGALRAAARGAHARRCVGQAHQGRDPLEHHARATCRR